MCIVRFCFRMIDDTLYLPLLHTMACSFIAVNTGSFYRFTSLVGMNRLRATDMVGKSESIERVIHFCFGVFMNVFYGYVGHFERQ